MIDLHSHILPGIDDGPGSEEQSVAMAEAYVKAGFTKVAATPHAIPGTAWMPEPDVVYEKVDALKRRLESGGIDLKIYPGMEVALDGDLGRLMDEKRLVTIADGPYMLIELPFQRLPLGWEQIFFDVQSRGYWILVGHPERCEQMMAHPELYEKMAAAGVWFQCNYDAFLGGYGPGSEEAAFFLAQKGMIHCLATDSHSAADRGPGMVPGAAAVLEDRVGRENFRLISRENPERVIAGRRLLSPAPGGQAKNGKRRKPAWLPW
jgi:protein-tyrosine phosphatase